MGHCFDLKLTLNLLMNNLPRCFGHHHKTLAELGNRRIRWVCAARRILCQRVLPRLARLDFSGGYRWANIVVVPNMERNVPGQLGSVGKQHGGSLASAQSLLLDLASSKQTSCRGTCVAHTSCIMALPTRTHYFDGLTIVYNSWMRMFPCFANWMTATWTLTAM